MTRAALRLTFILMAGVIVFLVGVAALDWFKGLLPNADPGGAPHRPVVASMSPLVTGTKRTLFHKTKPPIAQRTEQLPVVTLDPTPEQEKEIEQAGFTPPAPGAHLLGIWPVPPPGFHVKRAAGNAMVRLEADGHPVFTFVESSPDFLEWGGAWEAAVGPSWATGDGVGVTARVGKDLFRTGRLYWHAEAGGDLESGKLRGRAALLVVMRGGD